MKTIFRYVTEDGKDIVTEWIKSVKDTTARIAIDRRINRMAADNFGDHKFCRDGVWELRIDVGAGYRVYYAQNGKDVVLLLCGGNKSTQNADIERACLYWENWKRRPSDEE